MPSTIEIAPPQDPEESKKPNDSAFKQQRLKASRPVLTPTTLLPWFAIIGVLFTAIGIGMVVVNKSAKEIVIDYTFCNQTCDAEITGNNSKLDCVTNVQCYDYNSTQSPCKCREYFTIDETWPTSVNVYYGLKNFFQNHRSYVKSRDDNQLLGDINSTPSSNCNPFRTDGNGKTYIPCGAIANSLFSDTIKLFYVENDSKIPVELNRLGIAWESDKNFKFRNPVLKDKQTLKEVLEAANYIKPKNWLKELWDLDPENEENNGLQNEDLMVWMRTAALPNFRKLYRRIIHKDIFKKGLPEGKYMLEIDYNFDVVSFSGRKEIILSTTSVLGGKNDFFGIAYIVVGCICCILALFFFFIGIRKENKL